METFIPIVDKDVCIRAREISGLSRRDFANLLLVSYDTVRRWEKGKRLPGGLASRVIELITVEPKILELLKR